MVLLNSAGQLVSVRQFFRWSLLCSLLKLQKGAAGPGNLKMALFTYPALMVVSAGASWFSSMRFLSLQRSRQASLQGTIWVPDSKEITRSLRTQFLELTLHYLYHILMVKAIISPAHVQLEQKQSPHFEQRRGIKT